MAFAQVFECPNCGDVWKGVEIVEFIDCGRPVTEKVCDQNGKRVPVWHALSEEELDEEIRVEIEVDPWVD